MAAHFGSSSAKPRAVRVYTAEDGWVALRRPIVLTAEAVSEFKHEGCTMVEARWRLQTKRVSLSGLS